MKANGLLRILYAADPDTFDSLTLLNSSWHQASRDPRLYAYQIAECGCPALPSSEIDDARLPLLIRTFAGLARRELFETLLRPRVTEIQLVCSASSSAAAFPGGEPFRFEFSAKGTHLLALSSNRIFVLDLSKRRVQVTRELKISKRPVTATILDDGSVLAVLSSNHHVTLYDLRGEKAKYIRSLPLDNEPRTIALSPGAEVLGAAIDGGIEVYSLGEDALPTDRRAVNCDTVDSLAFSADGTILLGTTLSTKDPTTVILSAQHFSIDMPCDTLAQLWTTQVLFPRSSRDSSHACLLPERQDEEGNSWTFTYDRVYETFRAVRVDDLRNGHTYFTGPSSESDGAIAPVTLPASTNDGGMVATGFGDGKLWLYGLPSALEPGELSDGTSPASTPERSNSNASGWSNRERSNSNLYMMPQWQALRDKMRNVFVPGREIGQVDGLAGVKFVRGEDGNERLVAVAGGGVDDTLGENGEEEFVAIGGGRVILYELGRSPRNGERTVISVEIGDGVQGPVETLAEEDRDIQDEVDIVRRRTVAMRRQTDRRQTVMQQQPNNGRASPRSDSPSPATPGHRNHNTATPTTGVGAATTDPSPLRRQTMFLPGEEDSDGAGDLEVDMPYTPGAPRSRQTLDRVATVSRRILPQHRYANVVGPDGRPLPANHSSGPRGQLEDDWVPPPPPYTPSSANDPPLPPLLVWSMQGPPRPEVIQQDQQLAADRSPPRPRAPTPLERTRSTFESVGDAIRRRTVFGSRLHLSTYFNLSTTDITTTTAESPRSAPVTPAAGEVHSVEIPWASARSPHRVGSSEPPVQRRGSAGDILNMPQSESQPLNYSRPHRRSASRLSNFSYNEPAAPAPGPDMYIPPVPAIPQHHLEQAAAVPPPQRTLLSAAAHRRPQLQLHETYATSGTPPSSNTPSRASNARRRSGVPGSGSVRRHPSRAERSAAANMRNARKQRGRRDGNEDDGKGCSIM